MVGIVKNLFKEKGLVVVMNTRPFSLNKFFSADGGT